MLKIKNLKVGYGEQEILMELIWKISWRIEFSTWKSFQKFWAL